jgi:hypothetical protein
MRTRKYIFPYVGSSITKGSLKGHEMQHWERIKFYNDEAKRLRLLKRQITKAISFQKRVSGEK